MPAGLRPTRSSTDWLNRGTLAASADALNASDRAQSAAATRLKRRSIDRASNAGGETSLNGPPCRHNRSHARMWQEVPQLRANSRRDRHGHITYSRLRP